MSDKHDEMARELLGLSPAHLPEWAYEGQVKLIANTLSRIEQETEARVLERVLVIIQDQRAVEFGPASATHNLIIKEIGDSIRALSPTTPTANEKLISAGLAEGYVRVPKLGEPVFDMRVTKITRQEAREIAELLGGGAVLWQHDKCYPTMDVMCELRSIQAAPDGEE